MGECERVWKRRPLNDGIFYLCSKIIVTKILLLLLEMSFLVPVAAFVSLLNVQFLIIVDSFYTIFWLGYSYANSFDSIPFNICLLPKQSIKLFDSSPIVCFQLFASQPAIHPKHPAYTNKTRNLINRKEKKFPSTPLRFIVISRRCMLSLIHHLNLSFSLPLFHSVRPP